MFEGMMRLWALALLLGAPGGGQEASPDPVVEAMQARVPPFRDAELRYIGFLEKFSKVGILESRLRLIPEAGFRTDGAVHGFSSPVGDFGDLEIAASAAEVGEDLHFWAVIRKASPSWFLLIPPGLRVRGSRNVAGIPSVVFPADFPCRWLYEDMPALWSLAPRLAAGRHPGLKAQGRRVFGGRECEVLEAPLRMDVLPSGSILRLLPVARPVWRFLIEARTGRPWRAELGFSFDENPFRVLWEAKSWKEVDGMVLPDEVEVVLGPVEGSLPPVLSLRKKLSFCRFNGGLKARDLRPGEEDGSLWLREGIRTTQEWSEMIEKTPGDAGAYVGRAVSRYAEVLLKAIRRGPETRVDPAEVIPDLEKAREIEPASPFVNLFLLHMYEGTREKTKLADLVRGMEERFGSDPEIRLALARFWLRRGEAGEALRWVADEDLRCPSLPLSERMAVAALKISALDQLRRAGEGGRILLDLARGTGPSEAAFLSLRLARLLEAEKRAAGEGEMAGFEAAFEAALALEPRNALLREAELRHTCGLKDPNRVRRALEACVSAVDDPEVLDRAAGVVIEALEGDGGGELDALPPAAIRMADKAPNSRDAVLLSGLAGIVAGRRPEALARLGSLLEELEKKEIRQEEADGRADRLVLLVQAFSRSDLPESALRACRLFIRCVNLSGQPYRYLRGDGSDPVSVVVSDLLARARYRDVFGLLRDLEDQRFNYLHNLRRILRPQEEAFIRSLKEEILERSLDPQEFRKAARLIQRITTRASEAVLFLEKARTLAPKDVEVLHELAMLCMGPAQDRERAAQLFEELAGVLEKTPTSGLTRDQALFMAAHLHQLLGRPGRAVETLDRIDLKSPLITGSLLTIATIYDQAGRTERAIEAYRGFVEKYRHHPHMVNSGTFGRLGMLYEKTGNWDEAYRAYSLGIEAQRRERERGVFVSGPGGPSRGETWDPAVRREALLERIGRDYFLERFLRGTFEPLTEEETRRVGELRRKLGSDAVEEREGAEAELRKMGPKVAPHLRDGLNSPDPEYRARVLRLLSDWSEPR